MLALALTLSVASGGLLSENTFSARLVQGAADVSTMSRSELEMERVNLLDHRPGIAGGIVLLSVGGGVTLLVGLPIFLFIDIAVGVVISVLGLGAVAVGIVLLVVGLNARAASATRIQQIEDRIRVMEQSSPPPPPPPPPASWLAPVEPSLTVATF